MRIPQDFYNHDVYLAGGFIDQIQCDIKSYQAVAYLIHCMWSRGVKNLIQPYQLKIAQSSRETDHHA